MSCYAEQKFLLASVWTPLHKALSYRAAFSGNIYMEWELHKPGGQSQKLLESAHLFAVKHPVWKSVTHSSYNDWMDK